MAGDPRHKETITRPTRSQAVGRKNLKVHRANTTKYQNTFTHKAAISWNALPTDIHKIQDKKTFKAKITSHLKGIDPNGAAHNAP